MNTVSEVVSKNVSVPLQPEKQSHLSNTASGAIYTPLQAEKQKIRLVIIAVGTATDAFSATLLTVLLNDNPDYEALSYTWGDAELTHTIMLDGKQFHVRENLDAALRRLRLTDKPRIVWIDAICINQEDVQERNSQVLLMSPIFTSCRRGLIWLGEEDEETEAACRLIQAWSRDVHYSEWEHLAKDLAAVAYLVKRPWWSRIWTIQEVLLPAEKIMLCGSHTLSCEALVMAKKSLQRHQVMDCCQKRYVTADTAIVRLLLQFTVAVESFAAVSGMPFLYLADLFRNRQATDPRDKLIALLSLATPNELCLIVPDYSADIQELYTQFVVNYIQNYGSLESLSSILGNQPHTDLPSWVPDCRLPIQEEIYQAARRMRYGVYDACLGLRANIATAQWHDKIMMKENGILFDTIKSVSDECSAEDPVDSLKQCYESAKLTLHDSYVTGETFESAFWRTMMLDTSFVISATLPPHIARTAPEKFMAMVALGLQTLNLSDSSGNLEDIDVNLDLSEWFFALVSGISCRRFFITDRGYIGLGSSRMQVGDLVYVLSGSRLPLVLRAVEALPGAGLPEGVSEMEQVRTFVGDCYVHGIMDEEFVLGRGEELRPVCLV